MSKPYSIEYEVAESIERLNKEVGKEKKLQLIYMWVKQGLPQKVFIRIIEEINK